MAKTERVFNLFGIPNEASGHEGPTAEVFSTLKAAQDDANEYLCGEYHYRIDVADFNPVRETEVLRLVYVRPFGTTEWLKLSVAEWREYEFPEFPSERMARINAEEDRREARKEAMAAHNEEVEPCDCADRAPAKEHWVCPDCDAEWHPE